MLLEICQRQVLYYTYYFLHSKLNLISSIQVENCQPDEVIDYGDQPETEFQRYIRLSRKGYTLALLII
jgi:hypothetical protein